MEDDIRTKFESVCNELNIDETSKDGAWKEYQDINNDYVLEGPQLEWLACAIYVACRSSTTHTLEGDEYLGNSISLTQILRATKLRLVEFFRKIKKWLEMARLPPVHLEKVEALERKFEVISVIFNKYNEEFLSMFTPRDHKPNTGGSGRPRSRKPNKAKPCTSTQLFQFGWVLYIHIKNQFPLISDDLVNSHYLLLCCLDTLCAAVIAGKRTDLLNQSFDGLPEGCESPSRLQDSDPDLPWILPELCRKFSAIEKECMVVREYYWWPSIKRLYGARTLQGLGSGSPIDLQDVLPTLLNTSCFQSNLRALNQAYELTVLQEGDFDERVFLNSPNDIDGHLVDQQEPMGDRDRLPPPGIIYQSPRHLQYGTPLTGREYISSRDNKLTPVSDANQSVIQLHILLDGCSQTPCEELVKICSCCPSNPMEVIGTRIDEMSQKFLQSLNVDSTVTPDNFALDRLRLSQTLYYKLLAAIVKDEERKVPSSNLLAKSLSIQNMLEHESFHQSLFALCVEIVLFSYNSHSRIFPWILGVLSVSPFHFYKVIEVVIKVEPGFPRTIVKHLSKIEESVLSSLAWESGSPFFDLIEKSGSVPCYADVSLPDSPGGMGTSLNSPATARLKMMMNRDTNTTLSIRDRYSSPIPQTSRRQLFTGKRPPKSPAASPLKVPLPIAPKPPQGKVRVTRLNQQNAAVAKATAALMSLIQQQPSPQKPNSASLLPTIQALLGTSPEKKPPPVLKEEEKDDHETVGSVAMATTVTSSLQCTSSSAVPQPKRTGSVALFYRKVYQMAFLRTKDLCERLSLDMDILKQVWTCFEYCLMRSPDLMRDRHIDQLVMCTIYVVAKVLRKDVTFQEIMRQYRHQPQAKSHVYRSVLLNNGKRDRPNATPNDPPTTSDDDKMEVENEGPQGITTKVAVAQDSGRVHVDEILYKDDIPVGTRGDIIQFYNKIYIGFVKDYVLKFSPDEGTSICSMSPLPIIKRPPVSPWKVSKNHHIFVSPLKGSNHPSMSPLAKTFVVSKSPASDLKELNSIVGSTSHSAKIGARRQLDILLNRTPIVSPVVSEDIRHSRPSEITRSTTVQNGGEEMGLTGHLNNNCS